MAPNGSTGTERARSVGRLAVPNSDTCAFRARRAADRSADFADRTVDICEEVGTAAGEMIVAVFAARKAKICALRAEAAAEDRDGLDYDDALQAYRESLRHEQSAALALRRLEARLPHLRHMAAEAARTASAVPELPTDVAVVGDAAPFRLARVSRKDAPHGA